MGSRWNRKHFHLQIVISVVLLLLGSFSTGIADSKKILLQPKKSIVQKVSPATTKRVQKVSPAATKIVRAKKLPDLSVSNITIAPPNPIVTEKIIVTAVVKNSGTSNCPPSSLKIQIGGKLYPLIHVPGLAHNKIWRYKTKLNIKRQGNYRITAVINPDKKIAESNYKNNTLIKKFRVKKESLKSKLKRRTPPPSDPTPHSTPTFQVKPIEVSWPSIYHAQILEFGVRHEQEGYYWKLLYENTSSESLPQYGYFVQVHQISSDGSEQMAGREWVMGPVSPGDTKEIIDTMAWQKEDDTVSLRVALWQTMLTGNHRLITSKTIPFPMDKLSLKPLELAAQFFIEISELEITKNSNPEYLQWHARITNASIGNPSNNRLRARAIIISNDGTEEPASGNGTLLSGLRPGASFLTNGIIAMGSKRLGMDQLRLEIFDTEKNITIKSATIPFPSNAVLNAEPVYRSLQIQSSEYLGNGQWNVEVKNTGNQNVNPNDFTVTAKYHTNQSVLPVSQPLYNNTVILPGQTETISGLGMSNETGCDSFWCIDINVYYPVKDRTYVDVINTPNVLSATIDNVRLVRSQLSWRLRNSTPYPIKVTVEIESIEIWGPKPDTNDNSWLGDAWDFVTSFGEFDTSGLPPLVKLATAANINFREFNLKKASPSEPNSGIMYTMIDYTDLNSKIRAKCPGVNFSSSSYLFKNLKLKLSTAIIVGNVGNATGPNNYCNTAKLLDKITISEGGSQASPAFSW